MDYVTGSKRNQASGFDQLLKNTKRLNFKDGLSLKIKK